MKIIVNAFLAFVFLLVINTNVTSANSSVASGDIVEHHQAATLIHQNSVEFECPANPHYQCSIDLIVGKVTSDGAGLSMGNSSGNRFRADLFQGIQINPILAPPRFLA